MDTVTPEPQAQQEPLYERLATAAGVASIGFSFDYQRQILFPILSRNGATITVSWTSRGECWVDIYEDRDCGAYEFRSDGDVAAAVARALERYWGLEQ